MSGPCVILASASPRRRELLSGLLPDFGVMPSAIDESPYLRPPLERAVQEAAKAKALDVAARECGCVVIGADTIVTVDGRILGKPRDREDAARMLRLLSGRSHSVITGLAIVRDGRMITAAELTEVEFARLTDEQIAAYTTTGEADDKAGAYGIQGRASLFVKSIRGCYFNVVGLPLYRLGAMLEDLGIVVWKTWSAYDGPESAK